MASLIRRRYTSIDPKTGRKVRRTAKKWYGQYVDAAGIRHRVPLSANKTAAQQMLNELVRKAELAKAGILDPFEEQSKRPLTEHLADWETVLQARKNTDEYVRLKVSRARKVLEACGFTWIADLSASRVEACLADMRRESPRCGTQTSNHYLAAVKQFARWLVKDRRTNDNPLAHLEGGNVRLDRRHERRELADAELVYLLDWTRQAGRVRQMDGPDREMLYLVSVYTGLRASELASLTPTSFVLDGDPAALTVEAAYSKHRREDVVPLHPDLVRRLRPWLAKKPKGEPVWPGDWAKDRAAGLMLKTDLKRARFAWIQEADPAERAVRERSSFLAYRDEDGRVADFHALRHTYITRLVRAGVKPKEAQALARHSTISLTMDRYTHIGLHDVAAAVGLLPALASTLDGERQAQKATGTDPTACTISCTNLAPAIDTGRVRLRTDETAAGSPESDGDSPQVPVLIAVENGREGLRTERTGFEPVMGSYPHTGLANRYDPDPTTAPLTTSGDGPAGLAPPLAPESPNQPPLAPPQVSIWSAWPAGQSATHRTILVAVTA